MILVKECLWLLPLHHTATTILKRASRLSHRRHHTEVVVAAVAVAATAAGVDLTSTRTDSILYARVVDMALTESSGPRHSVQTTSYHPMAAAAAMVVAVVVMHHRCTCMHLGGTTSRSLRKGGTTTTTTTTTTEEHPLCRQVHAVQGSAVQRRAVLELRP